MGKSRRALPVAASVEVAEETEHWTTETLTPPRQFNDGWIDKPVGKTNPRAFIAAIVVSKSFEGYCKSGHWTERVTQ